MIGEWIDRALQHILRTAQHATTPTERHVDNNRLARDVVYHAVVAAEKVAPLSPWNSEEVHAYVRRNVEYLEDADPNNQRLRMPWRTVFEGKGDCKSTAIMIAALAKASGRHAVLRFVDQEGEGWDHVYAVVDGVPVDPMESFGTEVPYIHRHDEPI